MPNTVVSSNMFLPIPVVGTDPGPQYATDINTCLSLVDSHDHSSGYGVQITPSGININADLPLNSNNLTTIKTLRFSSQTATPAGISDVGCLYELGVDLFYIDGAGNNIRMTQSGGIAGTPGSIANLVSPASASYVSASQKFVWQQDTNKAATMDFASMILRNTTTNSKGLTISPPAAMAADISMILPTVPSASGVVTMDTAGNMSTSVLPLTNVIVAKANPTSTLGLIRGYVDGGGTIISGEGFTCSHLGPGTYRILFTTLFSDVPAATITAFSNVVFAVITDIGPGEIDFVIITPTGGSADNRFTFIAVGKQ